MSYNGTAYDIQYSVSFTPSTNTWYHIAIVRNGNTWYTFIDGDSKSKTLEDGAYTADLGSSYSQGLRIGFRTDYPLNGYVDEFRISTNVRYTSNFTPSTTAFTSDANTTLLLHFEGAENSTTFTDSGITGHTITPNGDVKIVNLCKFGGASCYLDGTGDDLSIPNSTDWDLGTAGNGDFTLEFWLLLKANANTFICAHDGTGDGTKGWQFGYYAGGAQMYLYTGSGTSRFLSWSPSLNTWYHIALVRSGSTVTNYVDGASIGTFADGDFSSDGCPLFIGQSGENSSYANAYFEELRLSKGIARYTSDFTPPATAFQPYLLADASSSSSSSSTAVSETSSQIIDE
jgi:hypothetical protein